VAEKTALQLQIDTMDKKLDGHGDDLKEIRRTLETIAVQSVQIANLSAIQTEHHATIEHMRGQLSLMMNWQAGCPRNSVNKLWGMLWGLVIVLLGAFIAHIINGGPK